MESLMTCTQKPNYQIDTPHIYTCYTVGSLVMLFPPLFFAYFTVSFTCNCDRFVETNNWIRSSNSENRTVNEMKLTRKKIEIKPKSVASKRRAACMEDKFFFPFVNFSFFCRCCRRRCHETSEHFSCDCNVIRNLLLDMSQWAWIEQVFGISPWVLCDVAFVSLQNNWLQNVVYGHR